MKAKKIKLSDVQLLIVKHMKEGYELGSYHGMYANVKLQHGGCGNGGKALEIRFNSFVKLKKLNVIEEVPNQKKDYKLTRYQLSEIGKLIDTNI